MGKLTAPLPHAIGPKRQMPGSLEVEPPGETEVRRNRMSSTLFSRP